MKTQTQIKRRQRHILTRCIAARLMILRAGIPALFSPPPPDIEEIEIFEKRRKDYRRKTDAAPRPAASSAFYTIGEAGNADLSVDNEPFMQAFNAGFNA